MERLKQYVVVHFEAMIVFALILAAELITFYAPSKLIFLNFFYLPVLVAGYYLGKRSAITTGLAAICLTTLFFLTWPSFATNTGSMSFSFGLAVWAFFLLLAAVLIGTLYEQRELQIGNLKVAYVGILEILSKYLDSYDRYTQGHSVRVAKYATEIAIALAMPRAEVENVRVAGLLHDIGKVDVSIDLIRKSVKLSQDERQVVDEHSDRGAKLLGLVGVVLEEAIPLVQSHHADYRLELENPGTIPLGARVIAVADTYDAMITDRPYRKALPPWEAITEIEKGVGSKFDPAVVDAFKRVLESNPELEMLAPSFA